MHFHNKRNASLNGESSAQLSSKNSSLDLSLSHSQPSQTLGSRPLSLLKSHGPKKIDLSLLKNLETENHGVAFPSQQATCLHNNVSCSLPLDSGSLRRDSKSKPLQELHLLPSQSNQPIFEAQSEE
jgi:hypothetical protein